MLVDHFTRACGSVFSYFIADGSVADCTKRRYLVNIKVFFLFQAKIFLQKQGRLNAFHRRLDILLLRHLHVYKKLDHPSIFRFDIMRGISRLELMLLGNPLGKSSCHSLQQTTRQYKY